MALAKFPALSPPQALGKLQLLIILDKFLNECILCDPDTLSWWAFRQELLWTLEVDDLMKANSGLIKKLFTSVMNAHHKEYSLEDAVKMVAQCSNGLKLTDTDATLAFAYSKFPVTDEMQDIHNVEILTASEFYEFIARLAQIKFRD